MSNNKRIKRFVGRPELLDDVEQVYRWTWLQPITESQVPFKARVYDDTKRGGWTGKRAGTGESMLEVTWLASLWKEVDDPLSERPSRPDQPIVRQDVVITEKTLPPLEPVSESDDSESETLEVPTE